MKNNLTWNDVLKSRMEIFGFAALWILLFHIGIYNKPPKALLYIFNKGAFGVDLFLFLSAIGLHKSISKNNLKSFYANRIKRVFIPYLVTSLPFFVWYDFINHQNGIINFLLHISTLSYWTINQHQLWYVPFILILYLLYPLLNYTDQKTKHMSSIILIILIILLTVLLDEADILTTRGRFTLGRFPIFMLGILLSEHIFKWTNENREIGSTTINLSLLFIPILIIGGSFIKSPYLFYLFGISVIPYIFFLSSFFSGKYRFITPFKQILSYIGKYSLEIYMIHMLIIEFVAEKGLFHLFPKYLWFALLLLLSLFLSTIVSKISKLIIRYF